MLKFFQTKRVCGTLPLTQGGRSVIVNAADRSAFQIGRRDRLEDIRVGKGIVPRRTEIEEVESEEDEAEITRMRERLEELERLIGERMEKEKLAKKDRKRKREQEKTPETNSGTKQRRPEASPIQPTQRENRPGETKQDLSNPTLIVLDDDTAAPRQHRASLIVLDDAETPQQWQQWGWAEREWEAWETTKAPPHSNTDKPKALPSKPVPGHLPLPDLRSKPTRAKRARMVPPRPNKNIQWIDIFVPTVQKEE